MTPPETAKYSKSESMNLPPFTNFTQTIPNRSKDATNTFEVLSKISFLDAQGFLLARSINPSRGTGNTHLLDVEVPFGRWRTRCSAARRRRSQCGGTGLGLFGNHGEATPLEDWRNGAIISCKGERRGQYSAPCIYYREFEPKISITISITVMINVVYFI